MLRYYLAITRTRSFVKQPVGTILRGVWYLLIKLLGTQPTFLVRFGGDVYKMHFRIPRKNFGTAGIFVQRQYYEDLLEFGHKLIDPGDVVVDGGANQGIFSCAFAGRVGSSGHVFAFEPLPYAADCLRRNISLNRYPNVTVFEGALSASTSKTVLDLSRGPVSASIARDFGGTDTVEVGCYRIDDLQAHGKGGSIQFIKLDVEGAELSALKGAEHVLVTDRPRICIEATESESYREVASFLAGFGYKPYIFDGRGNLIKFNVYEPRANAFFLT